MWREPGKAKNGQDPALGNVSLGQFRTMVLGTMGTHCHHSPPIDMLYHSAGPQPLQQEPRTISNQPWSLYQSLKIL